MGHDDVDAAHAYAGKNDWCFARYEFGSTETDGWTKCDGFDDPDAVGILLDRNTLDWVVAEGPAKGRRFPSALEAMLILDAQ